MSQVVIAITSGNSWRVPADCTSIKIEIIGAGDGDSGNDISGGGGAYATATMSVTPLQKLTTSFGGSGDFTWISNTGFKPTVAGTGCSAASGISFHGGSASNCFPTTGAFSGGDGRSNSSGQARGGGGGAAGPNGNGANGGAPYNNGSFDVTGGGGGGANGGFAGANGGLLLGGVGGNGRGGTGGGAAGTDATAGTGGGGGGASISGSQGLGAQENIWTDWLGNTYGPCGGTGGGVGAYVTTTGYGAGGDNNGGPGLIIITYTPVTTAGTYTEVFTTVAYNSANAIPWRVPLGVSTVTVEAIGAGGCPQNAISGRAGGGGAYAKTTSLAVTSGNTTYVYPAPRLSLAFSSASNSWFNKNANAAPSNTTDGVLAAGGASGLGGTAANSIGVDLKYSGGDGGLNNTTATFDKFRGGGGGGSAGPNGNGKAGGNAWNTGTTSGTGGGGGGSNGGFSSAGSAAASSTVGGAGGNGTGGSGGGAGGTSSTNAGAGTANTGAGGGGGSASATNSRYDGAFGASSTIWTVDGVTYGPSGGSGGAGCTSTVGGKSGSVFDYGGGQGSGNVGGSNESSRGLVVLTYTMASVSAATGNMFLMF